MIVKQPWTFSFVREWWPYLTARSILKLRDYEIRAMKGDQPKQRTLQLDLKLPESFSIVLRETGSDILTFQEVLRDEVYKDVIRQMHQCNTVIDLGANIGLTTLYFAHHFKSAQILAVEPNPDSYRMLQTNTGPLTARCRTLQAAVWNKRQALTGDFSSPDHYSAFKTKESARAIDEGSIIGLPIDQLIRISGFEMIDLLKVDIEGAEVQLFDGDLDWLNRIRAIAIEFHSDSRKVSKFDEIMRQYNFRVDDSNAHTVVAIKVGL
jgi:FkbM family methyltransferase